MTVEKSVHIENKAGIHCRPSAVIIKAAGAYPNTKFTLKTPRGETDLRSLLALLALGLQQGDAVTIRANGTDEAAACNEIAGLFEFSFDYPPQN